MVRFKIKKTFPTIYLNKGQISLRMESSNSQALEVINLSKTFESTFGEVKVLSNINFSLTKGEVIGIRGENGCGKTTLFNIIAGIDEATDGYVLIHGNQKNELKVGVVFQNYTSTLLPWLNIEDNICIPLKIHGCDKNQINTKLEYILRKLKFENLPLKNFPHQLSGGQKQKVAIARSLIREPKILLLDEPFANLDFQTSIDLQNTIQNLQDSGEIAIIIVSHNIDHILFLSNRVLILSGSPATIVKEFSVNLSETKSRSIILTEGFRSLRNQILEFEYSVLKND
jgi:NitT/TauT family transport system ATP-binding protein